MQYKKLDTAIIKGNYLSKGKGLYCVGWYKKKGWWVIYPTAEGAPRGIEPEFMCIGDEIKPFPLSSRARKIFS